MRKISQDLLPQLHDATVRTIVVDYATGAVTIGLRLSEHGTPGAELRALEFTALRLPRSEPWGKSTSVNKANISELDGNGVSLLLQLQSGDELAIEARAIEVIRD